MYSIETRNAIYQRLADKVLVLGSWWLYPPQWRRRSSHRPG